MEHLTIVRYISDLLGYNASEPKGIEPVLNDYESLEQPCIDSCKRLGVSSYLKIANIDSFEFPFSGFAE